MQRQIVVTSASRRQRAIAKLSGTSTRCLFVSLNLCSVVIFVSIAVICAATDTIAVVELAHFGAAESARSQQIFQQVAQRVGVRGVGAARGLLKVRPCLARDRNRRPQVVAAVTLQHDAGDRQAVSVVERVVAMAVSAPPPTAQTMASWSVARRAGFEAHFMA